MFFEIPVQDGRSGAKSIVTVRAPSYADAQNAVLKKGLIILVDPSHLPGEDAAANGPRVNETVTSANENRLLVERLKYERAIFIASAFSLCVGFLCAGWYFGQHQLLAQLRALEMLEIVQTEKGMTIRYDEMKLHDLAERLYPDRPNSGAQLDNVAPEAPSSEGTGPSSKYTDPVPTPSEPRITMIPPSQSSPTSDGYQLLDAGGDITGAEGSNSVITWFVRVKNLTSARIYLIGNVVWLDKNSQPLHTTEKIRIVVPPDDIAAPEMQAEVPMKFSSKIRHFQISVVKRP